MKTYMVKWSCENDLRKTSNVCSAFLIFCLPFSSSIFHIKCGNKSWHYNSAREFTINHFSQMVKCCFDLSSLFYRTARRKGCSFTCASFLNYESSAPWSLAMHSTMKRYVLELKIYFKYNWVYNFDILKDPIFNRLEKGLISNIHNVLSASYIKTVFNLIFYQRRHKEGCKQEPFLKSIWSRWSD